MCLHSLQPQDAVKKAADAASNKASDAADSAKFTLNKDLPISKGTIDAPDTILDQALPEAAKNLPPPPSKPLNMLGPLVLSACSHIQNSPFTGGQALVVTQPPLLLPDGMTSDHNFKYCMRL